MVVAWMWRVEEPLAERRQDLVAAREKMSAMCAGRVSANKHSGHGSHDFGSARRPLVLSEGEGRWRGKTHHCPPCGA